MKKILINNAVPTNNGDAALIFALYEKLTKNKDYEVNIATNNFELVSNIYPNIPFVKDILDFTIVKKARFFKYMLVPLFFIFYKPYREANVIISAPGGYINSYYSLFPKLYIFVLSKIFGKKVYIYSQSIGPLSNKDKKLFKWAIKYIDKIVVRDGKSFKYINANFFQPNRVVQSYDAAFMLEPFRQNSEKENIVAISVREWTRDNRDMEQYKSMIKELLKVCIDNDFKIEFISTCQGLKNYIDDSKIAQEIYNELNNDLKKFVIVDKSFYTLDELRNKLTKYQFTIGTRLHMCILSLLSNTPAFNISYEFKGKEVYNYLNLQGYSIDFNNDINDAKNKLNQFIVNYKTITIENLDEIKNVNIKMLEELL